MLTKFVDWTYLLHLQLILQTFYIFYAAFSSSWVRVFFTNSIFSSDGSHVLKRAGLSSAEDVLRFAFSFILEPATAVLSNEVCWCLVSNSAVKPCAADDNNDAHTLPACVPVVQCFLCQGKILLEFLHVVCFAVAPLNFKNNNFWGRPVFTSRHRRYD